MAYLNHFNHTCILIKSKLVLKGKKNHRMTLVKSKPKIKSYTGRYTGNITSVKLLVQVKLSNNVSIKVSGCETVK